MIQTFIQVPELQWKQITVDRHEFLITEGEVEKYIYFVLDGAVRAYLLTDEEEHTIRFGYSNSIMTSINSYFTGEPSKLFIQALRKTSLLRTTKNLFESYINQKAETMLVYQEILKDLVASFMEREIDLLTKSPSERLNRILKRSPQLFQEVPHKYIASYLRMSPETLSRLLKS